MWIGKSLVDGQLKVKVKVKVKAKWGWKVVL